MKMKDNYNAMNELIDSIDILFDIIPVYTFTNTVYDTKHLEDYAINSFHSHSINLPIDLLDLFIFFFFFSNVRLVICQIPISRIYSE